MASGGADFLHGNIVENKTENFIKIVGLGLRKKSIVTIQLEKLDFLSDVGLIFLENRYFLTKYVYSYKTKDCNFFCKKFVKKKIHQ